MKIRKVEPKLFGLHHCRICDMSYNLEDMEQSTIGLCKECFDKIQAGLIDSNGRDID